MKQEFINNENNPLLADIKEYLNTNQGKLNPTSQSTPFYDKNGGLIDYLEGEFSRNQLFENAQKLLNNMSDYPQSKELAEQCFIKLWDNENFVDNGNTTKNKNESLIENNLNDYFKKFTLLETFLDLYPIFSKQIEEKFSEKSKKALNDNILSFHKEYDIENTKQSNILLVNQESEAKKSSKNSIQEQKELEKTELRDELYREQDIDDDFKHEIMSDIIEEIKQSKIEGDLANSDINSQIIFEKEYHEDTLKQTELEELFNKRDSLYVDIHNSDNEDYVVEISDDIRVIDEKCLKLLDSIEDSIFKGTLYPIQSPLIERVQSFKDDINKENLINTNLEIDFLYKKYYDDVPSYIEVPEPDILEIKTLNLIDLIKKGIEAQNSNGLEQSKEIYSKLSEITLVSPMLKQLSKSDLDILKKNHNNHNLNVNDNMSTSNSQTKNLKEERFIPFPVAKLQDKNIFGVDIDKLEQKELERLQNGNYSDKLYNVSYTNKDGQTVNVEARLFFSISGDRETVKPNFLPKQETLEIKDFLPGGYKLKDENNEKDRLIAGETIHFINKPVVFKDGIPVRSEKVYNFLAKVDSKTNQVIVKNMDSKLNLLNNMFKNQNKIYGVEISKDEIQNLREGKSIVIQNPVFRGEINKGPYEVKFDIIANNNIVKKATNTISQSATSEETKLANTKKLNTKNKISMPKEKKPNMKAKI